MDPEAVFAAVAAWPIETQRDFANKLFDRLEESEGVPVPSPELLAELERRLDRHEKNPGEVYSWEEVFTYVRRR